MDEENGREEEKRRQVLTWALVRSRPGGALRPPHVTPTSSFSPPRALASRWGWGVDKSDTRTGFFFFENLTLKKI